MSQPILPADRALWTPDDYLRAHDAAVAATQREKAEAGALVDEMRARGMEPTGATLAGLRELEQALVAAKGQRSKLEAIARAWRAQERE